MKVVKTLLILSGIFLAPASAKNGVCRPTGPSDTANWIYYMGKCYSPITVRDSVNFNEATNICSEMYGANSRLTSVGDEEVAGFLVSEKFIADRKTFRKMMIGLRFSKGHGHWADNSFYGPNDMSYSRFTAGMDPIAASSASAHSDLCTVLSFDPAYGSNPNTNGRWSLVDCTVKLQHPIIACARIADESDECAPGSHFRPDGLGCVPCNPGTYQPTASRTFCEPCSPPRDGYIIDTEGGGATSQLQCHRPLPVLTSIDPGSGLQAGSTMVKLEGANFLIDSNLTVTFGDAPATIVASDSSYIICQSPPYTTMSKIPSKTNGVTVPVEIRFSNGVTRSTSFIYRPNPTVDRFEPTTFVLSGGQNVAVRGSDFDAAQTHVLVLQVSYKGTPYTVLRSHCSLESPMLLLCKTPDLSALLPKASSSVARTKRQAQSNVNCQSPFNARDWSFRFIFVFEQTYQVSADADVPVAIFEDPSINRWSDDIQITGQGDTIIITGSHLACGIRSTDVSVMVADRICDIKRITSDEIICSPPHQVSPSRDREPVMVQIGSHIAIGVGNVHYAELSTVLPTSAPLTTTTRKVQPKTKRPRVTIETTQEETMPTTTTPIWMRRITAPTKLNPKPVKPAQPPPAQPHTQPTPPAIRYYETPTTTTSTTTSTTTTPSTPYLVRDLFTEPEIIEELLPETRPTRPPPTPSTKKATSRNPYFVTIFWGPNGPPSQTPSMEKELMPMIEQSRKITSTPPPIFVRKQAAPETQWKAANSGRSGFGIFSKPKTTTTTTPALVIVDTEVVPEPAEPEMPPQRTQPHYKQEMPAPQPSHTWPGHAAAGSGARPPVIRPSNKLPEPEVVLKQTIPPLYNHPPPIDNVNVVQRSSVVRGNNLLTSDGLLPDAVSSNNLITTTQGLLSGFVDGPSMSSAILIAIVAGATLIMLMVIIITAVLVSTRARRSPQKGWRKAGGKDPRKTTSTRSLHSTDSVSTITFRGGPGPNSGSLSDHGTMVIENGHVLTEGGVSSPATRANLAAAVATIDRLPLVLHNKINDMLIHAKRIKVTNTLVRGQYGDICVGKLWPTNATSQHDTITVTIKTLNRFVMDLDSTSLIEAFLSDALMLKGFYHRNVSAPYAIAFSGQRPLVIYPHYENGSLKSYITNKNKEILVFQLLDFASQIATAMVYLSAQNFVHKDLATRNCVVTPDFEVKVADNALVKDVYGREYVYVEQARDFLPVRWMAPESLTDLQFSLKSDVWSFGVLLWELLTRGRLPHAQIHNSEIVSHLQLQVQQHALGGTRPVMRLPRPSNVPPELCDIVDKCCQLEPSRRPTFGWLQERLTTLLDQRHMMPAYNVPIMPVEGTNSPTTGN